MKKISAAAFIVAILTMLTGCAPALYSAAQDGDIVAVKALLNQGADVNEKGGGAFNSSNALFMASLKGHYDVVKLLLDRGANIDQLVSPYNITPLAFAAMRGHTDVVKLLIERGADINKAILGLSQYYGPGGNKESIEHLKEFKREKASSQNILTRASAESPSPAIKSDVDDLPSIVAVQNKNAYALVIGIERYR